MPGWSREEAIMRIRAAAEKCGHEPATGDMEGNVGAYCRIFGTWEHAKEEAGVKGYVAPKKEKPPVPTRTYKYVLTEEEWEAERQAFFGRKIRKAMQEAEHERKRFSYRNISGSNIGRRFEKSMREDEYIPPRDAILVALSTRR